MARKLVLLGSMGLDIGDIMVTHPAQQAETSCYVRCSNRRSIGLLFLLSMVPRCCKQSALSGPKTLRAVSVVQEEASFNDTKAIRA